MDCHHLYNMLYASLAFENLSLITLGTVVQLSLYKYLCVCVRVCVCVCVRTRATDVALHI